MVVLGEEGETGSVCSRLEKFLLGEHGLVSHLLGEINGLKRRPSTVIQLDSQKIYGSGTRP